MAQLPTPALHKWMMMEEIPELFGKLGSYLISLAPMTGTGRGNRATEKDKSVCLCRMTVRTISYGVT